MSKRRRDDEDSDEEHPSFGRQILPVAHLPKDFNGIPMDGLQYLFTVRRDAQHLPMVTRVANPYEVQEPVQDPANHSPSSHPALPSEAWRTLFQARFRNFRENAAQPTINVQRPRSQSRKVMPETKERDLWWAFLAGKPETEWNPPRKPKQTTGKGGRFRQGMRAFAHEDGLYEESTFAGSSQEVWRVKDEGEVELALRVDPIESLPTPSSTPAPPDLSLGDEPHTLPAVDAVITPTKPKVPTPTLLRLIDQKMALHLLMYFTHWMNSHLTADPPFPPLTETHAQWIFALLSRVEDYISADDTSLLRNLARACVATLRKSRMPTVKMENDKCQLQDDTVVMRESSLWIIISAVTGVWGQRDLWADAEEMLRSLDNDR